jgi:hypothetical protein
MPGDSRIHILVLAAIIEAEARLREQIGIGASRKTIGHIVA